MRKLWLNMLQQFTYNLWMAPLTFPWNCIPNNKLQIWPLKPKYLYPNQPFPKLFVRETVSPHPLTNQPSGLSRSRVADQRYLLSWDLLVLRYSRYVSPFTSIEILCLLTMINLRHIICPGCRDGVRSHFQLLNHNLTTRKLSSYVCQFPSNLLTHLLEATDMSTDNQLITRFNLVLVYNVGEFQAYQFLSPLSI